MKEKKISIIISVYNEENAIDKFFEEFDKIKSIYVTQKSELTNFKELNLNEVNKIFL